MCFSDFMCQIIVEKLFISQKLDSFVSVALASGMRLQCFKSGLTDPQPVRCSSGWPGFF